MTQPVRLNVVDVISEEIAELLTIYTLYDIEDSAELAEDLDQYLDSYPLENAC